MSNKGTMSEKISITDLAKVIVQIEKRYKSYIAEYEEDQQFKQPSNQSKPTVDHSQTLGTNITANLSIRYPPKKGSKFMSTPRY